MYLRLAILFLMQLSFAYGQGFSEIAQANKYKECLMQVEADSNAALLAARKWFIEGGGVPAQHCEALALSEQERYQEAASLFELGASNLNSGAAGEFAIQNKDLLSVQLNYLAGVAWRAAGEFDKAYNIFTAAIISLEKGAALSYDIFIDRGLTQFLKNDHLSAIEDYSRALEINERKIDAFLYRAEAYRKLSEHIKARLDLNEALNLEPFQPDLLFESGINYRMQSKDEQARAEWEKLLENYPATLWEQLAKDNIKLLGN